MLGFILSKMQMLLFATGIFVVVLMMLNFTSTLELRNNTSGLLELNVQSVNSVLAVDTLCTYQSTTIPEYFSFGLGNSNRFYYELNFSKIGFEDNSYQKLILSINERNKTNIVDAKSVNVYGNIVLVDPVFLESGDNITSQMVSKDKISLFPRQAVRGKALVPPNAFVILKENISVREDGKEKLKLNLYIVPCTTLAKSFSSPESGAIYHANNCEESVLKLGCYLLKERKGSPVDTDLVPKCVSITSEINEVGGLNQEVTNFSWRNCLDYGFVDK